MTEKLLVMAKWQGCPMVRAKLRKSARCMGCRTELRPKEFAFRSMIFGGTEFGVQRFERVCVDCIKAEGTDARYNDNPLGARS